MPTLPRGMPRSAASLPAKGLARLFLFQRKAPQSKNAGENSRCENAPDCKAFGNWGTHGKWKLGDIGLTVITFHRHNPDELPHLRKVVLECQRTGRIFFGCRVEHRLRTERPRVPELGICQIRV